MNEYVINTIANKVYGRFIANRGFILARDAQRVTKCETSKLFNSFDRELQDILTSVRFSQKFKYPKSL